MTLQHRSRLFRRPAILLCLICFAWPAAAPAKPKAHGGGRKTVCVASTIGRTFELKTVGLMVFGNDRKSTSIGPWGIDNLVVQKLRAGLGSGFAVRPVTLPASALAGFAPGPNIFGARDAALQSAIRNNTKSGCAYYLIVTPYTGTLEGTNQNITGLGILKSDGLFKKYSVYAVFAVQIYDGRNAKWIRQPIDAGEIFAGAFSTASWMPQVDETYWPATPGATVRLSKLRGEVRSLVARLATKYAQRIRKTLTRSE